METTASTYFQIHMMKKSKINQQNIKRIYILQMIKKKFLTKDFD